MTSKTDTSAYCRRCGAPLQACDCTTLAFEEDTAARAYGVTNWCLLAAARLNLFSDRLRAGLYPNAILTGRDLREAERLVEACREMYRATTAWGQLRPDLAASQAEGANDNE